jgi:hypothetical protein
MYSTIPIHWNIKSAPASPGRSRAGPSLYVFSLLGQNPLQPNTLSQAPSFHSSNYIYSVVSPKECNKISCCTAGVTFSSLTIGRLSFLLRLFWYSFWLLIYVNIKAPYPGPSEADELEELGYPGGQHGHEEVEGAHAQPHPTLKVESVGVPAEVPAK